MRISDWSSDVCSSDLSLRALGRRLRLAGVRGCAVGRTVARLCPRPGLPVLSHAAHANETENARRCGPAGSCIHPGRVRRHPQGGAGPGLSQQSVAYRRARGAEGAGRSEEHTSELQSLMRISYAVFCLKKKKKKVRRNVDKQYKSDSKLSKNN